MKKRLLSLILAAVLILGVCPVYAQAVETVTVNFTSQAGGAFLHAPQFGVTVSSDLADTYGYTDAVTGGVSALDVLVKAHEIKYGGSFTKDSKETYLVVNSGSINKIFETETTATGFIINGAFPNDGIKGTYGYGGYSVNQAPVEDGDLVEFFIYKDQTYYLDNIVWFCKNGTAVDSLTASPGSEVALTLKGLSYAYYGSNYSDAEAMHTQGGSAICGMQLAWVDIATGKTSDISGCVTDESDGTVTVTMPSDEGTYYLTVTGTDDSDTPAIMSLTKVVVDNNAPSVVVSCDLTSLTVADLTDSGKDFSPAFNSSTTSYSLPVQKYSTNAMDTMFKVKFDMNGDNAAAVVKHNNVEIAKSGDWYVCNGNNALQPGKNNILTITVSDGGKSKTYTVTIPMQDASGNAPNPAPNPEPDPDPAPSADSDEVMHAIAAKYATSGIASDSNAPWIAADMAAYAMAFPDTESRLSAAQKQEYLDKLIPLAAAATPSDLAKYIIALRAMGYDARKLVTAGGESVDLVKKLTDLVDAKDASVLGEYTLPYVLLALRQGEGYATAEQITYLKEKALEIKDKWQTIQWGSTDAAPPMILALSPYYGENEVKAEIDAAVQFLKDNQDAATGALNYGGKASASSTGLAIMALASVGEDPALIRTSSGKSLIDGLMATVNEQGDGFDNAFGTEQGFRGLVSAALQKKAGAPARVFDFASMPMEEARVNITGCPVEFSVVPDGASVELRLGEEVQSPRSGNYYDLAAGSYTYTVTKSGYRSASGSFEVSAGEAAAHTKKNISVSLVSEPAGGKEEKELTVTVRVLTHDGDACGGKWTYKNNADKFTVIADTTVTVTMGQTAFDAFALAMDMENVAYTEKTFGYISEIAGVEEFSHGGNSGWQYMIGGTLPTVSCRDYELRSNVTISWFYTDDYTKEKGSEQWGGGSGGAGRPTDDEKVTTELTPSATVSNGEARAEISADDMSNAIADAKTDGASEIVIAPEVKGEASKVSVELPKASVDAIANQTGAGLTVKTDIANITIPASGLSGLAKDGGTTVSVSAEAVKDTDNVRIEVAIDGKAVEQIAGGIAVTIPAAKGGSVLVIVKADGTEEVVKKSVVENGTVSALLDGSATIKVVDNSKPFGDTAGHWAKDAVAFASSHELFNGTGEDTFSPDMSMSRAMLATVLFRLEDAAASGGNPFTDVAAGAWYSDAVAWANGAGIVTGTGSGFAPDRDITRQELVTMLYRYAGSAGLDTGKAAKLDAYADSGNVAGWAQDAMSWAVGSGLVSGRTSTTLAPEGTASRAEVAAVMQRLVTLMVK